MMRRSRSGALRAVVLVLVFALAYPANLLSKPLDVTGALRLMREARSSLEAGDAATACALYEKVVARFPTWWMSLVGRVRCGLERGDSDNELALILANAERYEAPPDVISELRSRLLRKSGKMQKLSALDLPVAIKGGEVSVPLRELLVFAWLKGRLGDALRVAQRMRDSGQISSASLRLGAEAALLTKDAKATDVMVPEFLDRHPDRVLMVRYIRDLQRRGREDLVEAWTRKWRSLVRLKK